MKVLVACEMSGVVREAFRKKGHNAYSCDLLPSLDESSFHYRGDIFDMLQMSWTWDLMIAHPPCTALTVSGNHRYANSQERMDALDFIRKFLDAPIDKIALENPVGVISTNIRKPDQIIQPYEFGDDASKKTCLWLKGLEPLVKDPARRVPGRIVDGKERWGNQTDSGQNKLPPSKDRAMLRSITYQGIADAMAEQWG